MALVIEKPVEAYDLTQIARGNLVYAKHYTWTEGKAGFVTSATEEQLIVQYHPGIGNVTNHFFVPVSEAVQGQWEIRWSKDLTEVFEYPSASEEGTEENEAGSEETAEEVR